MNQDKSQIKERLLLFQSQTGLSVASFERKVGLSNGYIRNFNGTFGGNRIDRLKYAFPDLNISWLMTGQGTMLIQDSQTSQTYTPTSTLNQPNQSITIETEPTTTELQNDLTNLKQQLSQAQSLIATLIASNHQLTATVAHLSQLLPKR